MSEQRISAVFHEDAGRAPALDADVAEQVVRIVRRRRTRWGVAAGATVAVLAIGASAGAGMLRDEPAPPAATGPRGALPGAGSFDCEPPESPAAVAARTMSFDGTVTAIAEDPVTGTRDATVTFKVNEWFRGGPGPTATATMRAPLPPNVLESEAGPAYTTGTRLLVSGDAPGGRLRAWGCGYTRYYDDQTAAAWRQAARER
ncbi:hypothetical protein [Actinoplanes sp. RD1]|uniref:hypothetical protein n=1 Tax=Actinoplanes sp. RD1 TaxID=3064538 RepID=UPI002740F466|nr:hypothetical protein [Actinoplanes sp. RD1]